MRLSLNEQEVVDGVCVVVANWMGSHVDQVDVKELSYKKGFGFCAEVTCGSARYEVDGDDIRKGIRMFLEQYHNFNPEIMGVYLNFTKKEGFTAEVVLEEGEEEEEC
ncbi:DUF2653 family protein [Priestia megaterium]|uniref:DUF2653 family protein n=1 Tax=Priestia megaterium TaxID=1404 RepID=UPI002FFFAEB9